MNRYLYVMLSGTDTCMGRLIRRFTPGDYNHVSLSLDAEFLEFVSFARYHMDVPLAGGYVKEPARRLLTTDSPLPVRIFRLSLTQEQAQRLESLFAMAGNSDTGLIYNSLGALFSPLGIPCHLPGSYTCLEFANLVLGCSCPNLLTLGELLADYEVFQGDYTQLVHDASPSKDPFFVPRGFWRGFGDTLCHFGKLFVRLIRLKRVRDPFLDYQLNVLKNNENAVPV